MSINIKVGETEKAPPAATKDPESPNVASINLKIRRALNGDIMIFDHADIDVIIMPQAGKVMAFPKEVINDFVYGAQDRLFNFLSKKGIIARESIQAGNVYGSMEAKVLPGLDLDQNRMSIINIASWIDEERPYFEFTDKVEDMNVERFTDPDDKESTELGEVPHEETKGTLRPGYNYGPYWQNYTYE